MATTLYVRNAGAPNTLPSAWLGAWTWSATLSSSQKALQSAAGSSTGTTLAGPAETWTTTAGKEGMCQAISRPLAGQSAVSAASWTVEFATKLGTSSSSASNQGAVGIYLVSSTGALKTTIFALATFGTGTSTTIAELGHYSTTVAGLTFTPGAGDRIVVEFGCNATSSTSTIAETPNFYYDGATAITADNATTSNPASLVICPTTLVFAVTTLYLRKSSSSGVAFPPLGHLDTALWNVDLTSLYGVFANQLSLTPGAAESSIVSPSTAMAASTSYFHSQWLSPPLAAISLDAVNWTIAFAASFGNTTVSWKAVCSLLLVNGATGTSRVTLVEALIGSSGRTNAVEVTVFGIAAGAAWGATAGDYLCFEIGIQVTGSDTTTLTSYQDGTTAISSDNITVSNAQSMIQYPGTLVFLPVVDLPPPTVISQAVQRASVR